MGTAARAGARLWPESLGFSAAKRIPPVVGLDGEFHGGQKEVWFLWKNDERAI